MMKKKNIVELAENSKININDTNILVDRGIIDYNNDKIENIWKFLSLSRTKYFKW